MNRTVQAKDRLIERFKLSPHPEGGYYRETHRDSSRVVRAEAPGTDTGGSVTTRSASTCIYYMLCDGAYSAWHRIRSDEVWHFYAGDAIDVHVLDAAGQLVTHRLGDALAHDDAAFQVIVPAGCWFAAERPALADNAEPNGFSFIGCTVAPGFEFSEFELGDIDTLLSDWGSHAALIRRLAPRTTG